MELVDDFLEVDEGCGWLLRVSEVGGEYQYEWCEGGIYTHWTA